MCHENSELLIGLWSVGWCDGCLWPAHTMRQLLDRFDFRIGPTTVAFVKSTNDDRLWCAHTMRFSSFRRLCVQQKTKIAWCVPGFSTFVCWDCNYHSLLKLGTHHAIFVGTTIVVRRDDGRRSSNDPHTPRDDRRMTAHTTRRPSAAQTTADNSWSR